eukprot:Seg487.4 transcript_id=Seg487.4/GoldUCD/mRNA.D3Y31 product="Pre-rRNA-processing protein ESF2" protein_id=Seg487.4/GoldUCD/D3Y31
MADEESEIAVEKEPKKTEEGIIYISKVPPFMKPGKLRNLMSQFGEVGRLFLQPEDPLIRKKRKKTGGSGKKNFTEGWVEFKDKRIAKAVAKSLNGQILGGKKRGYYHDDIWNMKYLRKFKWGHISEKLAYEKAAREQRMRTEISQAKKEVNYYLGNVEKNKVITKIEERKSKKRKRENDSSKADQELENAKLAMKKYKQRKVVNETKAAPAHKGDAVAGKPINKALLSKVFGR